MTFLSPSALWLLGAISIPIAIHILSLMRVNKVEFSSIRFIKELKTTSIRKIRTQKLLLLLLRILIIVCLVMMMAQPVTQGFMPGWISAEQDSRLVFIVDFVEPKSFNSPISRASFSSTFKLSIIEELLIKLKSNLPFEKEIELNTNIEHKIIIKKIFNYLLKNIFEINGTI